MVILHNWIRSLTAASAAAAVAKQLTPAGPVKKVTELACAAMLLGVLILPALDLDMSSLALSMAEYRSTQAALVRDVEEREKQLLRTYIEQQCAAYILDEARNMHMEDIRAAVKVKWRDEHWVPCEARISGKMTAEELRRLSDCLTSELGIPEERQYWDDQ